MSYHPQSLKNDLDCPACKFGTFKRKVLEGVVKMRCIDCTRVFTLEELREKGVKI